MLTTHSKAICLWLCSISLVYAHASPSTQSPRPNEVLSSKAMTVKITFDGAIEPLFSTLRVLDATHKQVSKGNGLVDKEKNQVLETTIPALSAGTYAVEWQAVARDGHRSHGAYNFTVK